MAAIHIGRFTSQSDYMLALDESLVVIRDNDLGMTVTNNAAQVITEVALTLKADHDLDINRYRVIYLDTMDTWSELKVENSRFVGFAPLVRNETVREYARARELALTGGIS